MNKKLSLIVVMLFTFSVTLTGNFNSKFVNAEVKNGAVIGSSNLNNSSQNSAKVGVELVSPEKGWNRYDDSHEKFMYYNFTTSNYAGNYNGSYKLTQSQGAKIEFAFNGTKLRLISPKNNIFSKNITIKIDGVAETFSENDTLKFKVLVYEKLNLKSCWHKVEIISNDLSFVGFDALDIDGELGDISSVKPEEPSTKPDEPSVPSDNNSNVIENPATSSIDKVTLYITLVNSITKEYTISKEDSLKFVKWVDTCNQNKSTRYTFTKKLATEYILFDKIASFSIEQP